MILHPCRSQSNVPHGATACTAIAAMFGIWAAETEDVERLPFDEIVSVGALLWRSARDRMPPSKRRSFLQTEEVFQHPAVLERLGATEATCGSLLPGATADPSYSPYYASLAASIEKLREGNAGVFTFHEHSIGVARRSGRYYLFDSAGALRSTLARFDSARGLEDYVRRTYAVPDDPALSRAIARSRVPSADGESPELGQLTNRHAFTFVAFEVK